MRGHPVRGAKTGRAHKQNAVAPLLAEAVRHHRAGHLERAERLYQKVLKTAPDHGDALHLLGLVRYQLGDLVAGERLIRAALARNGQPAAYHNSLGVVLLASGRNDLARASFEAALERDPGYAEACNNLGNAYQNEGQFSESVRAYRRALDLRPDYTEAWFNNGRAERQLGRLESAAECFRRALELRADYAKAERSLGDVLGERGDRSGAEAAFRRALAIDPADAENHAALAALLERLSRLDEALTHAAEALKRDPYAVRAAVVAARCHRRAGRPQAGLQQLQALDLTAKDAESQAIVAFEQAALHDRAGDYDRAYARYCEANALMLRTPQGQHVDQAVTRRRIAGLVARFTAPWVQTWSRTPPQDRPSPAFLIGFPRSGTTLLDQILDAHPRLITMEEKDVLDVVRARIDRSDEGYPDALQALTESQINELRSLYFERAQEYLGGAPEGLLIDKMPLNTIDAGLIYRLFPDARIILALRHPCDVVLSAFMQAFQPNEAMVHFTTLRGSAEFYAEVMGLWQRYTAVLPLQVTMVHYEDLVVDFAGETSRLLDFLGVGWDDAVAGYAERAKSRAIATPSYHQVVQPIYKRSVGRWNNYRAAFTDILPILQPFIDAWGYQTGD
ncbi:MAG: sulfotransferase [Hyphomicrobiales bacterium]|nr:sulfotransferase [Hyphomicrobiales bacterium]